MKERKKAERERKTNSRTDRELLRKGEKKRKETDKTRIQEFNLPRAEGVRRFNKFCNKFHFVIWETRVKSWIRKSMAFRYHGNKFLNTFLLTGFLLCLSSWTCLNY